MTSPTNPYRSIDQDGGPLEFVGRAAELAAALGALTDPARRSVLVYGPRGTGKTALLGALHTQLSAQVDLRVVSFDLRGRLDEDEEDTAYSLVQAFVSRLGLGALPDLGPDPWAFLRDTWLPEVVEETHEVPVFLIDGYQPGREALLGRILSLCSGALRGRVALTLVLDGGFGDLSVGEATLLDGLVPLRLGHLSVADTRALVQVGRGPYWTEGALDEVWRLTGGHPALTHQLCALIWARWHVEELEVTAVVVAEAGSDTLEHAELFFASAWEQASPSCRVVAATLAPLGAPLAVDLLDEALAAAGFPVRMSWLMRISHLVDEWPFVSEDEGGEQVCVDGGLFARWITSCRPAAAVLMELPEADPLLVAAMAAAAVVPDAPFDAAIDAVRTLRRAEPDRLATIELEADLLHAAGRQEEATVQFRSLYERVPARAAPWLSSCLMETASRSPELHQRLSCYQQALAITPDDPEVQGYLAETWATRARQAFEAGRLVEAVEAFRAGGHAADAEVAMERWREEQAEPEWEVLEQLVAERQYAEAEVRLRVGARLFREDRPDALRELEEQIREGLSRVSIDGTGASAGPPTDELTSEEVDTPTSVPAQIQIATPPPVNLAQAARTAPPPVATPLPPVSVDQVTTPRSVTPPSRSMNEAPPRPSTVPPPGRPLVGSPPGAPASAKAGPSRAGRLGLGLIAVAAALGIGMLLPRDPAAAPKGRVTFTTAPTTDARLWVDGAPVRTEGPAVTLELAAGPHMYGYLSGAACDARCPGPDCPACCASCFGVVEVAAGASVDGVRCTPVQHRSPEVCDADGVDEDCNGLVNEADPGLSDAQAVFPDGDGDGHAAVGAVAHQGCPAVGGARTTTGPADDCDDAHAEVHPGATEVAGNLLDEDCDNILVYGAPGPDGAPAPDVPGLLSAASLDGAVHSQLAAIRRCVEVGRRTQGGLPPSETVRVVIYDDQLVGAVSFPNPGVRSLQTCLGRVFWTLKPNAPGAAAGSSFDIRLTFPGGPAGQ